ncbi:MAG: CapA family protein [Planctomycetes bacterium]|nr:CapA family protein [Planctomycetota bacterium]
MKILDGKLAIDEDGKTTEQLRVVFGGDFCPLQRLESPILQGRRREIFGDALPVLQDKDLSLINLEAPLTLTEAPIMKTGPNLKVYPECVKALKAAGVDVAILANNHIGDHGPGPVLETLKILGENGIHHVGAGADLQDARRPLFLTKKGRKIAILAFAENEFGMARKDFPGANPLQPEANIRQIRAAAAQADITLAVVHGGNEYNPVPSPRMRETYRAFAEAGASAVVCGHTHCPQGIEIWAGSPVVYSLGNLFFNIEGLAESELWWRGYLARISFGAVRASALEVIPYSFDSEQIRMLRDAERSRFFRYMECLSHLAADETESRRCWDAWCALMAPSFMDTFSDLKWPPPADDEQACRRFIALRNLFSCEAHRELITSFLDLWRLDKLDEAAAYIPLIKQLQKGLPATHS